MAILQNSLLMLFILVPCVSEILIYSLKTGRAFSSILVTADWLTKGQCWAQEIWSKWTHTGHFYFNSYIILIYFICLIDYLYTFIQCISIDPTSVPSISMVTPRQWVRCPSPAVNPCCHSRVIFYCYPFPCHALPTHTCVCFYIFQKLCCFQACIFFPRYV